MGEEGRPLAEDTSAVEEAQARRERLVHALTALVTLLSVWIAADPDGPARLWYRVRLWLAYRDTVNTQRLTGMRLRAQAGVYADDMRPTAARIGDY